MLSFLIYDYVLFLKLPVLYKVYIWLSAGLTIILLYGCLLCIWNNRSEVLFHPLEITTLLLPYIF